MKSIFVRNVYEECEDGYDRKNLKLIKYNNLMSNPITELLNDTVKLNELAKSAFAAVDTDNSGTIDTNEVRAVLNSVVEERGAPKPSEEDVKAFLENFDTNNDGVLSLEEFTNFLVLVLRSMEPEFNKK